MTPRKIIHTFWVNVQTGSVQIGDVVFANWRECLDGIAWWLPYTTGAVLVIPFKERRLKPR